MTRPQGDRPGAAVQPGKGKIGFTVIRKLSELTADVIEQAPILDELFVKSEWGGANELHYLGNNIFGVLGHIAKFDAQDNRHYYSIAFRFNLATKMISNLKIVAARKDIANGLQGASKRPDLNDVIFSGGIVRRGKIYDLYLGAGDAEVIVQPISEPF